VKTFGTFCSGIGAPEVAWGELGWKPIWSSEIEPFCCELIKQKFPDVPNRGDMTKVDPNELERPDVVCAGTPCQSFSVGGLRGGLDDERGNLALRFVELVGAIRPRRMVWENVPGVLSSWTDEKVAVPTTASAAVVEEAENARRILAESGIDAGTEIGSRDFEEVIQTNDFDQFTAALVQRGYSLAWGILDAQYFGVAQRRERVFVVGSLGNWTDPAAILFDRESLCGNPPPSREAGQRPAASLTRGADRSGKGGYAGRRREDDENIVSGTLKSCGGKSGTPNGAEEADRLIISSTGERSHCLNGGGGWGVGRLDYESETMIVAPTSPCRKTAGGGMGTDFDLDGGLIAAPLTQNPYADNKSRESLLVTHALTSRHDSSEDGCGRRTPIIPIQGWALHSENSVAMKKGHCAAAKPVYRTRTLDSKGGYSHNQGGNLVSGPSMSVRRLMPSECEKLQGFPPKYTAITRNGNPAADGPRYRAIGNSIAVPVLKWIGKRIDDVDALNLHPERPT
jgi:DNA (cytosine-5)-methyltransferase 1